MQIQIKRAALLAVIFLMTGCAVNPVTGKKEVSLMSVEREKAIGAQSDPAIIAQFGLYEDDRLQQFIRDRGQVMASISHRSELDYEFKILDSEVVNAFAVPGGYVYFTRGIMAHFNNEAQFAGVLGHEIGHIAARHSAQQYTKQVFAQIGFMAGMIVSDKFRSIAGEAMQGMTLLFLKFSREDESESDVLGVYYSSQVGYDAFEMAEFFNTLERKSGGEEGRIPEFLSTHPDPGRRYKEVRQLAAEYQEGESGQEFSVNRNSYLDMLDGIVYGPDPRQGYRDGNVFYHPELKFRFPVPDGWQLVNSPVQVEMAPEDGSALMVLRLAEESTIREAAAAIEKNYGLTSVNGGNRTINGLSGYKLTADLPQQDAFSGEVTNLGFQAVLVEYNGNIYSFFGLSEKKDFSSVSRNFDDTMLGFRVLDDPSRINVKPERIRIANVTSSTTFGALMEREGIPSVRQEELAILNGMELSTPLRSGDKVKLISK